MDLEETVFTIISHAGNAKSMCFEALNEARGGNFDKADELISKAKDELNETHEIQNKMIQNEACGKKQEVSLSSSFALLISSSATKKIKNIER